jgi:hypothetical protein
MMGRSYEGGNTQAVMESMKESLSSWAAAMDREDVAAAVEFSRKHLEDDLRRHEAVLRMARAMGRGDLLHMTENMLLDAPRGSEAGNEERGE